MQAHEMIEAAHQTDVEQARKILRDAVKEAGDQWISKRAISDALFLEFIETAFKCTSAVELAAQMTEVADRLVDSRQRAH
ncbi:MAG: hypothetical protein AAGK01_09000 [Pseudomonadota bacterium]